MSTGGLMAKHAAYCGTRNIYGDMETAAKSLIANSDVTDVWFVIEDDEFPSDLPSMIHCVNVSSQPWIDRNGPNAKTKWTWMVLIRAALCHVLPDVDKVLSLDCDTIVRSNVSDVWDLPVDGCYYAAVTEDLKSNHGLQYANFGVALFNLDKLRDGKADECIDVLNKRKYTWPEQDVFNYLCQGRICEMPKRYNDMYFNGKVDNPAITHYAAKRREQWTSEPEPTRYRNMSWEEVMRLHDETVYGKVLFVSNHSLERDEALRVIYDAYDGPKEFMRPVKAIANVHGYKVVVTDTLTPYIPNKDFTLVNVNHGITGDKKYALDEKRVGIDPRATVQNDYLINASTKTCDIVAGSFGVPVERVVPLGFPRADMYAGKRKGDGGTSLARYRIAYLYAPTFRGKNDGDHLPRIDWERLDGMLEDDELFVVKRHYFQREPIVGRELDHIMEVPPNIGSAPYIIDCDVLLTDYSSIIFDAYVADKPVVLAVDDMDAYLSTRGMYLDYPSQYSSRWLCAEGNEIGLIAKLRSAASFGLTDLERETLDLVADMCDGHATERVCDFIKGLL